MIPMSNQYPPLPEGFIVPAGYIVVSTFNEAYNLINTAHIIMVYSNNPEGGECRVKLLDGSLLDVHGEGDVLQAVLKKIEAARLALLDG